MTLSAAMPVPVGIPARKMTVRASAWDTEGDRVPYKPINNSIIPKPQQLNLHQLMLDAAAVSNSGGGSGLFSSMMRRSSSSVEKIDVRNLLAFPKQANNNNGSLSTAKVQESTYMGYERWLPIPPKVDRPQSSFNAAMLAYIGDCIYELYARRHFLVPAMKIDDFNNRVMAVVRCEAQDALLQKLLRDKFLTGRERSILRWGKNSISSKTKTKKRAGAAVYNRASSLETLVGYLYLTNVKRLDDVMSRLGFSIGTSNQSIIEEVDKELESVK